MHLSSKAVGLVGLVCLVTGQSAYASRGCEAPAQMPGTGLVVKDGYVEFIAPAKLRPLLDVLPRVTDARLDAVLRSPDTMWYDEESMVFAYQDSIETVTGVRANCVGRKVGENNASHPQISKLMRYFGPDFKFLFPFRQAAGTDNVKGARVINFWVPPRRGGRAMPVKYWKLSSRGRWRWAFPVDTLIGEILYDQSPNGTWYAFEIRTRRRYRDGWAVDVYRPFGTAEQMAQAVIQRRPGWASSASLSQLVAHLRDSSTLVSNKWESPAYGKVFPAINGALDRIPDVDDKPLIVELLTQTPFASVEGVIWKEHGSLQTYGPSSSAAFSIAPKGYEMGMIPVNEVSCNRCHSETGRRLGEMEFDIILYGEVWGEDQIFTWHPFEPNSRIYDTWDEVDGSRRVNQRMVQAGLVKYEQPSSSDPDYKPLPTVFKPDTAIRSYGGTR